MQEVKLSFEDSFSKMPSRQFASQSTTALLSSGRKLKKSERRKEVQEKLHRIQ